MKKVFTWKASKNAWLKQNRGISFEEVLDAIGNALLDVRENRSAKHKDQKIFIVRIQNYVWLIPFKESKEVIELITAFPDRRLLKEFKK